MSLDVIAEKLSSLQTDMVNMQGSIALIQGSMSTLVRLEERHASNSLALERAFTSIKEHSERLQLVERDLPALQELRKWVIAGVSAGVLMLSASAVNLVISNNQKQDMLYQLLAKQTTSAPAVKPNP